MTEELTDEEKFSRLDLIGKEIYLTQELKGITISKPTRGYLRASLQGFSDRVVHAAFEQARAEKFFNMGKVLDHIRDIVEQDPNHNPSYQWTVVYDQYERGNLGYLKMIFDNIRTNLAIEQMGGQEMLKQRLDQGGKYAFEKIRDEFIEKFRKAVIPNNVSWNDWKISFNPECLYDDQRKGKIYLVGCNGTRWIPETEVNSLLTISREQRVLTQGS